MCGPALGARHTRTFVASMSARPVDDQAVARGEYVHPPTPPNCIQVQRPARLRAPAPAVVVENGVRAHREYVPRAAAPDSSAAACGPARLRAPARAVVVEDGPASHCKYVGRPAAPDAAQAAPGPARLCAPAHPVVVEEQIGGVCTVVAEREDVRRPAPPDTFEELRRRPGPLRRPIRPVVAEDRAAIAHVE